MARRKMIGVIGASRATADGLRQAEEVGRLIAENGCVLVCGGLGGIMEGASRGCAGAGGEVVGIVPGPNPDDANPYVTHAIASNLGHARNVVIAHTADVLIAVEGEYGTISEAAIALKLGKKVYALSSGFSLEGVERMASPQDAVKAALAQLAG